MHSPRDSELISGIDHLSPEVKFCLLQKYIELNPSFQTKLDDLLKTFALQEGPNIFHQFKREIESDDDTHMHLQKPMTVGLLDDDLMG